MDEIINLRLIEKEEENNRLRQQLSELIIRYDALRTLTSGFKASYIPDDEAQKQAVTQALDMGKVFK